MNIKVYWMISDENQSTSQAYCSIINNVRGDILNKMNIGNDLLQNIEKIHTTEMGVIRIKKNLSLDTDDIVDWCKSKINSANAKITRQGKNWYVTVDTCTLTINAHSFTIITAHRIKK